MSDFAVVEQFEAALSAYTGAPYAVAVDRCRNGLFLCCRYLNVGEVTVPARTYCAVPAYVIHAGGRVRFEDFAWEGAYRLAPYPIWDAARRLRRGMFTELLAEHAWMGMERPHLFACLSFHTKKPLPIGSGGMILTDDADAAAWFRSARHDGRQDGVAHGAEQAAMIGWGMHMRPDDAARGLMLLGTIGDGVAETHEDYPDLREWAVFQSAGRIAA
jgi:dTDP-4-amino-4,6-dideoxygalactose transaminase